MAEIRNKLVETAIDIFLCEVANSDPYEPIRAEQIVVWAQNEYQCAIPHATVLNQLRRRVENGELMTLISRFPHYEQHFHILMSDIRGEQ